MATLMIISRAQYSGHIAALMIHSVLEAASRSSACITGQPVLIVTQQLMRSGAPQLMRSGAPQQLL